MDTKGLNSNQIKLIAIIAMTIDHVTWLLFPGFQQTWWVYGLHIIGRLTAPIMWFFIAEGFYYTSNVKKYILRLFIFAIETRVRTFSWTAYTANPRLCLYSIGLKYPNDIFILFSLYQRR